MTTKIHADTGIEFPDGTTQSSAAYSKAQSDGPAFRVYNTANQTLTMAAWNKLNLASVLFDTASCASGSKFQPNVAGYYQIDGSAQLTGSLSRLVVSLYKNGAIYSNGNDLDFGAISNVVGCVSDIIYFNGSTDYIELYCYVAGTSASSTIGTRLGGFLARRA